MEPHCVALVQACRRAFARLEAIVSGAAEIQPHRLVHPNYMGMIEAYQEVKGANLLEIEFYDLPAERDTERILIPLDCAHGSVEMLAGAIADFEALLENFARLAAEKILDDEESGGPLSGPPEKRA